VIHPATELRRADARIGYGVFATQPIPRGTITWVHDALDRTFSARELAQLPSSLRAAVERFSYLAGPETYVVCWDFARYSNHSCRPATRTLHDFDIAVRDVPVGGELTIEYAQVNVVGELDCTCGEPGCRRRVRRDDANRFGDDWDAEMRAAARLVASVAQPLAELFPQSRFLPDILGATQSGQTPSLPSCRELVVTPA
jgi:hypothetical protein